MTWRHTALIAATSKWHPSSTIQTSSPLPTPTSECFSVWHKATPTKTTSERRPPSTTGCYKIRLLNLRVLQNISSHDKMFQIQACTGLDCPISSWTRSLAYKGALDFEKLVGVYPRMGKPFLCYNLLLSMKMIAVHLWNWLQNPKNRTPRKLAKCSKVNICLNWKKYWKKYAWSKCYKFNVKLPISLQLALTFQETTGTDSSFFLCSLRELFSACASF